jgi:hypothetical protein
MLIILLSTSIVSADKVISKGMVNSQYSRQILTRKDIPVLSNTIALSRDAETREILKEARDKVSESGSITEQEIRDLMESSGWTLFIGIFAVNYLYSPNLWLNPGHRIFNLLGFYVGPFIVGAWEHGLFHNTCDGIVYLGVGIAFQTQVDPGARIFTHFNGICTLGFYKPN